MRALITALACGMLFTAAAPMARAQQSDQQIRQAMQRAIQQQQRVYQQLARAQQQRNRQLIQQYQKQAQAQQKAYQEQMKKLQEQGVTPQQLLQMQREQILASVPRSQRSALQRKWAREDRLRQRANARAKRSGKPEDNGLGGLGDLGGLDLGDE